MFNYFLTNVPSHRHQAGLDLGSTKEFIVLVVVVIELNEQLLPVNNLKSKYGFSAFWSFRISRTSMGKSKCMFHTGFTLSLMVGVLGAVAAPTVRMAYGSLIPEPRPSLLARSLALRIKDLFWSNQVRTHLISFTLRTPALSGHLSV